LKAGGKHGCLLGVELTNARRHEETFNPAGDRGNTGPAEKHVHNPEAVTPQIKMVRAKGAEKQGQQYTNHFIFLYGRHLRVKNCPLLIG